jgi:hypothetical protein
MKTLEIPSDEHPPWVVELIQLLDQKDPSTIVKALDLADNVAEIYNEKIWEDLNAYLKFRFKPRKETL